MSRHVSPRGGFLFRSLTALEPGGVLERLDYIAWRD